MIASGIIKRFDLIADTPGNIPRLRKLIVDLAVRGKLLQKTSGDESPTELLRRIAAKRDSLIKAGELRKHPTLSPIASEELPAEYSAHCVFERLCNIAILEKGLTGIQSAKRGEYPLVVTAEARSTCDHFDFDGPAAIIPMVSSSGHGDASLKRLHYQDGKFALGNILCAAFPISSDLISARFLYEYLTAFKEELLVSKMIGTANVSLTLGKIGDVPIPIVTPKVQRRVEELMGLCDALEAAQREREVVRTRLRTSALNQLASPDADSTPAGFVLQHFSRFTTGSGDLAAFRDLISWIAVEGGFSTGGTEGWSTDRFENVVELQGGVTKGRNLVGEKTVELPYLRVANVQRGYLELDVMKVIEIRERESDKYALQTGDLVITEGGDWDKVGRTAVWREEIKPCIHQNHVFRARPDSKRLWPEWGMLAINSRKGRDYFADASKQTTNLASINMSQLRRFPIPLPPLAEQRRIVAKVDVLMAVLDNLEAALNTARATGESLLAASIAGLSKPQPIAEVIDFQSSPEFIRATLAAEVADRMRDDRHFGQTKLQKIIYLVEHHFRLPEIDSHHVRYARGPHDPRLIEQAETGMKNCEWFEAVSRDNGKGKEYHPLAKAGGQRRHFEKLWPAQAAAIRDFIDVMKKWSTERCERFATVFGAWNDLLLWGESATDASILKEVLQHWHPDKLKISKSDWEDTISWMRREGYVPIGWGRATVPKREAELFPAE